MSRLLAALPSKEYERLLPDSETVSLRLGQVLYEPDELIHYVYFPVTSVISMLVEVDDGATVEVGIAGNIGIAGISTILGVDTAPQKAIVQVAGHALRIKASALKEDI